MRIEKKTEIEKYGVFNVRQLTQDTSLEDLVAVDIVTLDPNKTSSSHRHNYSDTILYIKSGRGEVHVGHKFWVVSAGDRIHIPPQSFHHLVSFDEELEFISIQTPPILNKKTGVLDLEEELSR